MSTKIKTLFLKYKELILYLVFGVLTTIVNFAVFWLFTKMLGEQNYLLNNAVAWVAGVVFAFITNKIFVFESKAGECKVVLKELAEFTVARLFSFGVEEGGMLLFITVLGFGEKSLEIFGFTFGGQFIVKVCLAVIVVILNYFFSKFIIFKKEKNK